MSGWVIEFEEKSGNAYVYGPRPDGNVRPSDGLGLLFRVRCATLATEDVAMFPDIDPYLAAVARKAAAADDLLAALKRLSHLADAIWVKMSDAESKAMREAWDQADAAIAKAEGRT